MEIGTEAEQFPEKEYINGIFVAVQLREQAKEVFKEQTRALFISVVWE